jgi:IclR family mhp operon transcriptional activator
LSAGFADEAWVAHGAKPLVVALSREIAWPVSVATLSGTAMMIRESSDHNTPLALERFSAGIRTPLLTSAMGRAFLAFCPAARRDSLLDELARSNKEEDKLARGPRGDLQRLLTDIKVQGYATVTRARRLVEETSLSVPVTLTDRVPAVLTVRFISSAVPLPAALERFLPRLRRGAAKLSGSYSEHQSAARATGAPHAAV